MLDAATYPSPGPSSASPTPTVTVCVPTVGRLSFLEETLASVIGQTFGDWELLVGENSGGPLYGGRVADLVARLTSGVANEVRIVHQPVQLSLVQHANALVGAARGRYVLYLPDDDRLRESCLDRLTAPILEDPTVDVVFSDHWMVRDDGTVDVALTNARQRRCGLGDLRPGPVADREVMAVAIRQSWQLQAMLVRKALFDATPFREERARLLDYDFQLRLAARRPAPRIVYCPERLVDYRLHLGQLTSGRGGDELALLHRGCIASLKECTAVETQHTHLYRRKVAQHWGAVAMGNWLSGRWRHACAGALSAIQTDPSWLMGYLWLIRPLIPSGPERRLRATARAIMDARTARAAR